MIIYIGKISGNTSASELHHFVKSACKIGFVRTNTSVRRLEIVKVFDTLFNLTEYHGLVYMDSDVIGQRVIKKLNGKLIKDKPVVVREYCQWRKINNDRRGKQAAIHLNAVEKRESERRRDNGRLVTQICGVIQRLQRIY